jgi:hypothetical protein
LHHLVQELVNPLRLGDDRLQRFLLARVAFMMEQVLSLAGDDGERVIDLMAGAGGELGQGFELASVEAVLLSCGLLLKCSMQLVQVALESFDNRRVAELAFLGSNGEKIAKKR